MDNESANFISQIGERLVAAKEEAIKHNITANTVVLNKDLGIGYTPALQYGREIVRPIICGMRLMVANLPDNLDFIITDGMNLTEHEEEFERYKRKAKLYDELVEQLSSVYKHCINEEE